MDINKLAEEIDDQYLSELMAKYGGTVTTSGPSILGVLQILHSRGYLGGVWQPIETAPKDGTEILTATPLNWDMSKKYIHQQDARIGNGFHISNNWYAEGRWQNRIDQFTSKPIAWMSLPVAPKGETKL